ncbi:MAG: hypothetical protein P1T08_03845 [Acidimicrobiia bacterium]|nr:hypothetical protein [Acidimicrobiia bacterium]
MSTHTPGRIIGRLAGAIIGLMIGGIVAVNLVIFAGVDQGYEASLPEVFETNVLLGITTVAILTAGPIVGFVVASRIRPPSDS